MAQRTAHKRKIVEAYAKLDAVTGELIPTGQAAKALGVSVRTLQQWVRDGIVTPALTTGGGQHRFDLADLKEQLRKHADQARRERQAEQND
jgi:excisionase family DNA binding protein